MRVLSAAGAWYRVRLPNGTTGFISARLTEPADDAVRVATLRNAGEVLSRPALADAEVMEVLTPGVSFDVLARFGDFLLVRSARGLAGWVAGN
jgi:SH3-like domain-containing protein